jgi:hypothetical protein
MLRALLTMPVFLVLVVPPPVVAAKEGIRARLVSPIPRDAPDGAKLDVAWTLRTADGGPLGASGFFVRLTGRHGSEPQEADAVGSGSTFFASVAVPPGGIEQVQIGLRGWRQTKDRPWEPADVFFPIEGQIFSEPADTPRRWPLLLLTIPTAGIVWWWRRLNRRR